MSELVKIQKLIITLSYLSGVKVLGSQSRIPAYAKLGRRTAASATVEGDNMIEMDVMRGLELVYQGLINPQSLYVLMARIIRHRLHWSPHVSREVLALHAEVDRSRHLYYRERDRLPISDEAHATEPHEILPTEICDSILCERDAM